MQPAPSYRKNRSSRRQMVHSAAHISVAGNGEHNGIVRDLSPDGIFLYSNFKPAVGADIAVTFTTRVGKEMVKIFTQPRWCGCSRWSRARRRASPRNSPSASTASSHTDTWCNPEDLPMLQPTSDDAA